MEILNRAGKGLVILTAYTLPMMGFSKFMSDVLDSSIEEQQSNLEACQEQLGATALQVIDIPDSCEPYRTVFLYRTDTETYRQPTDEELAAYFPVDTEADKAERNKDSLIVGGTLGLVGGGLLLAMLHSNRQYREKHEKKEQSDSSPAIQTVHVTQMNQDTYEPRNLL